MAWNNELSVAGWLVVLNRQQKLPDVEDRPFAVLSLVVDLFLTYLIVREGLRVCKDSAHAFALGDVAFPPTRNRRVAEPLGLLEFIRVAMTRNPVIESLGKVKDTTATGVCRKLQLGNILPELDPINVDLADIYLRSWREILRRGFDGADAKLILLLSIYPAMRGRKPSLAQWLLDNNVPLQSLDALVSFLKDFQPLVSRTGCASLVCDQKNRGDAVRQECSPQDRSAGHCVGPFSRFHPPILVYSSGAPGAKRRRLHTAAAAGERFRRDRICCKEYHRLHFGLRFALWTGPVPCASSRPTGLRAKSYRSLRDARAGAEP